MEQSLSLYSQNQATAERKVIIKIASNEYQITKSETLTGFAGISSNIDFLSMPFELLFTAVNNRTRERNYFQLLTKLLSEEISDDEFDKEIEENEDRYVLQSNQTPSRPQFEMACILAKRLMDINSPDDFLSLFSFSEEKTYKLLNDETK